MAPAPTASLVLDSVDGLPGWRGSFSIYQERAFAEVFASLYDLQVIEADGVLLLVSRRPLLHNMSAFVGSPAIPEPFALWWARVESLECSQVEIQGAPPLPALERHRTSAADCFSFVVDLRLGEEALWTGLSHECRKAIRKGRRAGLEIRETQDERDLRAFYGQLLLASEGGRRFAIAPYRALCGVMRSGFGRLFLSLAKGRPVGGAFYVVSTSLYGWFSCFLRELAPDTPSNSLYWEVIRWGATRGLRFHDFGVQSLSGQGGLTLFKKSYRPFLVPACSYRVPQSQLKLGLGSLLRRLRSSLRAGADAVDRDTVSEVAQTGLPGTSP